MSAWIDTLLTLLALPQISLGAVFIVSFLSATLLPLGSEPAVFALVQLHPNMFWSVITIATLGNTLGGALTWWIGYGAHQAVEALRHRPTHLRALDWLQRLGPKACLLSWLPVVGDPLCAVAGWQALPFWPCVVYMAIGKFARYVTMTALLMEMMTLWGLAVT